VAKRLSALRYPSAWSRSVQTWRPSTDAAPDLATPATSSHRRKNLDKDGLSRSVQSACQHHGSAMHKSKTVQRWYSKWVRLHRTGARPPATFDERRQFRRLPRLTTTFYSLAWPRRSADQRNGTRAPISFLRPPSRRLRSLGDLVSCITAG
jgi:hypothetical protein